MRYIIVENGIISNIIEADEITSAAIGALPYYEGAQIGGTYAPPTPPTAYTEAQQTQQDVTDLQIASIETQQEITELWLAALEGQA